MLTILNLRRYSLAQILAFHAAGLISTRELKEYCAFHGIQMGSE